MKPHYRYEAFDLYRALAVIAVVLGHLGLHFNPIAPWLRFFLVLPINYGVPLFFIISGYLLAASMARLNKAGEVGGQIVWNRFFRHPVFRFYGLRIRRIYPAYLFWLFILWGISPTDGGDLLSHLFNLHNLFSAYNRSINPVFWSLAVEFQWYLLAPLLFWGLLYPGRVEASRRLEHRPGSVGSSFWGGMFFFISLVILSITARNSVVSLYLAGELPLSELWRLGNEQVHVELYSFALGVWVWRFRESRFQLSFSGATVVWIGLLGIAAYTYVYFFHGECLPFSNGRHLYLVMNLKYLSQFFLALLVYNYRHVRLSRWLYGWVGFVAAISYSLYIVHYPVLTWVASMGGGLAATTGLYLFMSGGIAYLSYRWIERPFIRV